MYLFAQMFMRDSGYDHMYWGGFWWFLFLIFIVTIVVLIVKSLGNGSSTASEASAEELAKQRYAKGDITKKQYEDIIKTIKK